MDSSLNGYKDFIESVQKQPCLWNSDLEENKMMGAKEQAWKAVMEENDIRFIKEAKYLWKKLRDIHRQVIIRKHQNPNKIYKKWKYEDQMDFLIPYMKIRHPRVDISDEDSEEYHVEEEALDCDTYKESKKPKHTRQSKRIERVIFFNEDDKRSLERNSDVSRSQGTEEVCIVDPSEPPSALKNFFTSMCEMTSSLPEHLQMKVERKVFEVVMEAREHNLQSQLSYFGN